MIDTQQMDLYREAIGLTEWKENNPTDTIGLVERAELILEKTSKVLVKEYQGNKPVVIADHIEKNYGKGKFSLGPVSLHIAKGQVYGLVGENGNGKTTLLRILAKDLTYQSGTLAYNFTQNAKDEYALRTKLVYIPQRTQRWYGGLKDNLKFVLSSYGTSTVENETRVLMMIARLGLWKYKDLKWNELSSGYKMRFELARTLLRKPELLLLDEPLANLDIVSQQVVLEDLKSIANSVNNPIALILSSQQLYEVEKISDEVIYLRDGKYIKHNENQKAPETAELVVEIDAVNTREELLEIFDTLVPLKLTYNGGVYVVYFNPKISFAAVLEALGKNKARVKYVRNISDSTRRLFVS